MRAIFLSLVLGVALTCTSDASEREVCELTDVAPELADDLAVAASAETMIATALSQGEIQCARCLVESRIDANLSRLQSYMKYEPRLEPRIQSAIADLAAHRAANPFDEGEQCPPGVCSGVR
jgi:hypothetical protein